MNKGKLIVISGPAGIGKGTVCKEIVKQDDSLALSISWTTRDIRKNEIADVTYFYRSEEEFAEMVESGGFLEYAGIYGIVAMSMSVGSFIATPVWGVVYDTAGSYRPGFLVMPVIIAGALVLQLAALRLQEKKNT